MVLKFCANLSFMFQESSSLLERYELAKQAGFKGVECAFPYEFSPHEVGQAQLKAGVQQILINASPGVPYVQGDWSQGDRGLAAIPGKDKEFKSSIEQAIQYAKSLECKRIHIMAGVVAKETEENLSVYKKNLRMAAQMLAKTDIIGVIEPISQSSISNYFLNNYQRATSVIQEINSPNIKLQLDLFHMQQICGNLTQNIKCLLPLVGHVQVAQVPGRHEPNTPGEINYRYIYDQLEKLGYQGWIGLEYNPKARTSDGLNWIKEYGYAL